MSTPQPKRWAIFMGIDFYYSGNVRENMKDQFNSLKGCVRDVQAMEEYLVKSLNVEQSRIKKLTATSPDTVDENEPMEENPEDLPTYENMIRAFEWVTENATEGDLVYIHFSGHGARVLTTNPGMRGPTHYDEALVPTDILNGGRYLRDLEVAALLAHMVKKGLIVTVTLDCCHSGGAARGGTGPVPRGAGKVDDNILDTDRKSLISKQDIEASFRSRSKAAPEGFLDRARGWLLEPEGYELFAACRQIEKALENRYNGEWHGALSYHLLEAIKEYDNKVATDKKVDDDRKVTDDKEVADDKKVADDKQATDDKKVIHDKVTHGTLHQRVQVAILQDFNGQQTPLFAGRSGRFFFDVEETDHVSTFVVRSVAENGVVIDSGTVHAADIGTQYEIYRKDALLRNKETLLAVVTVYKVSDSTCKAEMQPEQSKGWPEVVPGCSAKLRAGSSKHLISVVPPAVRDLSFPKTRAKAEELHSEYAKKFGECLTSFAFTNADNVARSKDDDRQVYYIVINNDWNYELQIKTAAGNQPVPNFLPSENAITFLERVEQLALYDMIKGIKNRDMASTLKGKLEFGVKINGVTPSVGFSVSSGDKITVQFKNNSEGNVNFTLLNFQPLWGINQIYPRCEEGLEIDPGKGIRLTLHITLPDGIPTKSGVDRLKAFVSADRTNFRPLEMPDLPICPAEGVSTQRCSPSLLEELLLKLSLQHRNERVCKSSLTRWETLDIDIPSTQKPDLQQPIPAAAAST